ncbi:polyphosphate polymerase domain-containing protein [Maribacter polysaccharolyticus]|uniref:polyphosphate polymerase domain-containing protein n=1 Tax=Maribacter polysaccharolyticus TaxID=3020831 RepID=UPI00237F20F9|nr:polyphosphate polymerase domain-containing protein [Maribacter polysaccharolyticus]MDE3742018.1 polyphosphate polymerase domain-containing protein [Maribacter polysaccharolyticus]
MNQIINAFDSISLEEMNNVALMKRTDTKFIVHKKELISVLKKIIQDYKVLEIKGNRIMTYASLYFDTPAKKFYYDHHNGKVNRTKVRMRKYVESDICFLEVKQKDGRGKTKKTRTSINDFEMDLSDTSIDFIQNVTHESYDLEPIIWNKFNRITLVNKTAKERLTIDLNVSFKINNTFKTYDNLVIIEVKQERFNRTSPVVRQLKEHQTNPYGLSKYCIGMISVYEDLKYNRFKRKILKINKITA